MQPWVDPVHLPTPPDDEHRISQSSHSPSAPTVLEASDVEEPQLDGTLSYDKWEVRDIAGRKLVGGKVFYLVDWAPTWEPESEVGGTKELVDELVASFIQRESQGGHGDDGSKRLGNLVYWAKQSQRNVAADLGNR